MASARDSDSVRKEQAGPVQGLAVAGDAVGRAEGVSAAGDKPSEGGAGVEAFPAGLRYAYLFAWFNALSYQVVLGSPMILYAKSLGASATVLGVIAGMMPLLVILQIPAAAHIPRIGYRRFVLSGWSIRVMFILGMALLPLLGGVLDARNQLALLLFLLFGFNLSRGISSCAWLPWITALVPAGLRGRYLARDAAIQNLAGMLTFWIAALLLGGAGQSWRFGLLFAFSAVMGGLSLVFLKRIPDVPVGVEPRGGAGPVPWMAMLRHPPFGRLLQVVVAWSVAYGGMTAFTVAFLKSSLGFTEGDVLWVTSLSFVGGLSSLWFLGSRLDHLGSRPVIQFCGLGWLGVVAGWLLLAGGVKNPSMGVVLGLQFLMGLLAALVQMAHTRLAMAVIPVMGRNHFFALYSVANNVTLGLAPIGWGLWIDAVGGRTWRWLGLEWNRFSLFYAAVGVAFVVLVLLTRRLIEPRAVSVEALLREILIESPQRFWFRFWPRS
jgi:MFS family permease